MTIADVARATRKYRKKGLLILNSETLKYEAGNEAKCGRLNLLAVLEALREPSEGMVDVAIVPSCLAREDVRDAVRVAWRAMIDALIAEVSNDQR